MTETPKTVAIIQGRMGSSRLPGKILQDIAGEPMLARVVERVRGAKSLDLVAFATTMDPSDDPVAEFCAQRGYPCYRGSVHDVLDRYYGAVQHFDAQVIARVTADCPMIDPGLIDNAVNFFRTSGQYDFVANRLPPPWKRTYPIGLDVEVCSREALERAWREAGEPYHREHVMPYLYEGEPPRFRIHVLDHTQDFGGMRWTVDTPQDLEFVRQVFARFQGRNDFSWLDVLALLEREPELARLNAGTHHRSAFDVDDRSDLKKGP